MKVLFLSFMLFIAFDICNIYPATGLLDKVKPKIGVEYTLVLTNGDIVSGELVEYINSKEFGEGLKILTDFGKASIFENQISEISKSDNYYRHSNRMLLMPTAYPISSNHYASDLELLFPNVGIGVGNFASLNAGISLIPIDNLSRQVSLLNAKFTVLNIDFDGDIDNFALAVGANSVWLNSDNNIFHLFSIASLKFNTTAISAGMFYKLGNREFYSFRLDNNIYNFQYMNGSFGLALGLDKELNSKGTHFFLEIWNGDITRSLKSAIASGIRFSNTAFSADFGLMYAASFPIPIMNFTWTPF
jgi:hypothetical protein